MLLASGWVALACGVAARQAPPGPASPPASSARPAPDPSAGGSGASDEAAVNRCAPPPATEADGSPRPLAMAELSTPDGQVAVGLTLTVLGAPPTVAGGLEPSYAPWSDDPREVAGVLISSRWYRPLAWEQVHGSFAGYQAPAEELPEPSFTVTGRIAQKPMELVVFGADGRWRETIPLLPCAADPCAEYASPPGSVAVAVAAGTAARLGIGAGWSIAVGI
jgi:hypothetical protein